MDQGKVEKTIENVENREGIFVEDGGYEVSVPETGNKAPEVVLPDVEEEKLTKSSAKTTTKTKVSDDPSEKSDDVYTLKSNIGPAVTMMISEVVAMQENKGKMNPEKSDHWIILTILKQLEEAA